ncbi:MAG: DUF308 domain-containing protein [Flavobacteriales bacterium]|nr:DUF308 domain-containing protein [Flavobacteriales bacterium]
MFRNWWLLALKGVLLLFMGLFVLYNAELTLAAIVFYLGLLALVGGVAEVVLAVVNREQPTWTGFLLEGLLDIAIGVLLLTNPQVIGLIPVLLGLWIAISGAALLLRAFRARKAGESAWGNWLLLSAVLIVLGLWLMYDPVGTLVSVTWLLGAVFLAFGVLVLLIAFRLRGVRKALGELAEEVRGRNE